MNFTDTWQFAGIVICTGLFVLAAASILWHEWRTRRGHRRNYRIVPGFGARRKS